MCCPDAVHPKRIMMWAEFSADPIALAECKHIGRNRQQRCNTDSTAKPLSPLDPVQMIDGPPSRADSHIAARCQGIGEKRLGPGYGIAKLEPKRQMRRNSSRQRTPRPMCVARFDTARAEQLRRIRPVALDQHIDRLFPHHVAALQQHRGRAEGQEIARLGFHVGET